MLPRSRGRNFYTRFLQKLSEGAHTHRRVEGINGEPHPFREVYCTQDGENVPNMVQAIVLPGTPCVQF
jgi:hypothetical protein